MHVKGAANALCELIRADRCAGDRCEADAEAVQTAHDGAAGVHEGGDLPGPASGAFLQTHLNPLLRTAQSTARWASAVSMSEGTASIHVLSNILEWVAIPVGHVVRWSL